MKKTWSVPIRRARGSLVRYGRLYFPYNRQLGVTMKFNRLFTLTLITFTVWLAAGAPASAQGGPNLPPDVYVDSRNRLPLPMRDELDNKHKQTYDAVLARTGSVEGLRGMAGIELHGSSGNIRFESPAGRRLIELAIIVPGPRDGRAAPRLSADLCARAEGARQSSAGRHCRYRGISSQSDRTNLG